MKYEWSRFIRTPLFAYFLLTGTTTLTDKLEFSVEPLASRLNLSGTVLVLSEAVGRQDANADDPIRLIRARRYIDTDGVADVITAPAILRFPRSPFFLAQLNPTSWIASLPQNVQRDIVWFADHEEGSLLDWDFGGGDAGGGIFNTGGNDVDAIASSDFAHSGEFSVRATIRNAIRGENGRRAVRLMRWTDKPWDEGGEYFKSPAYFSTWIYIPEDYDPTKSEPWDPGDGGWWNVFQFKSTDGENDSEPMFSLNVGVDDDGHMTTYLWGSRLSKSFDQKGQPLALPSGEWVHMEAYYKTSTENTGQITIYQNGKKTIDVRNVQTVLPGGDEAAVWGIGNYTDHIAGGPVEGEATIYFDDAAVSRTRLSKHL